MAVKSAVRETTSLEERKATGLEEIVERTLERQGVRPKERRQLMQLPTTLAGAGRIPEPVREFDDFQAF